MDLPGGIQSFRPAVLKGDTNSIACCLEGPTSFIKRAEGIVISRVIEEEDEEVVWSEESDIEEFHLVEADDEGVSLQVAVRVVEKDVEVPPFSSASFVASFIRELKNVSPGVNDAVGPWGCWFSVLPGKG